MLILILEQDGSPLYDREQIQTSVSHNARRTFGFVLYDIGGIHLALKLVFKYFLTNRLYDIGGLTRAIGALLNGYKCD